MQRISDIKSLFKTTMSKCRSLQGGAVRAVKSSFGDKFVEMLIKFALNRNPERKNFRIERQFAFNIKGQNKNDLAKIKSDVVIFYKNKPVLTIEVKDYADADMYRRFVFDSYLISSNTNGIEHILFQFQNGLDKDNISKKVFDWYVPTKMDTFCMVDIRRNWKSELHKIKPELTTLEITKTIKFIRNKLNNITK